MGGGTGQRSWWTRPQFLLPAAGAAAIGAVAIGRGRDSVGSWVTEDGRAEYLEAYGRAFEAMPEPDEVFDLQTTFGVVRAYRFAGSGEGLPTVLLPGRGGASPTFAVNIPPLLELGDVYSLDLLGGPGMSVQEQPINDDADQASWLHQALSQLPSEKLHLMGVSIGGWTAANLARHHPESIRALTLVDPVFVFDSIPLGTVLRSIPASVPWMPQSWRDRFNSYIAGGAPTDDSPGAQMLEAGQRTFRIRLPAPRRIRPAELEHLSMPVLVILAGKSVMLNPPAAAESADRTLKQGTVQVHSGASHVVNAEHPAQIAEDVDSFLHRI